jgi:surfactin synthase thioesterase subunit
VVAPEELAGWRGYTAGSFETRTFPGDHFYTEANLTAVTQAITSWYARAAWSC